ncbi:MAG: cardiolipin synthase [Eubacteriales bacterium]|nr:cardiolipin synthase [Eubacteriales bacterium]
MRQSDKENRVKGQVSSVLDKYALNRGGTLRMTIVALAVIVQLVILGLLVYYLRFHSTYLYILLEALALTQVLILISKNRNTAYTAAWSVVFLILPLFGELLYLLWGQSGKTSQRSKRMEKIFAQRGQWLQKNSVARSQLEATHPRHRRIAAYLELQGYPLFSGSQSKYYPVGELQFVDLIEDIERAERFIFLEYYIVSEGDLWEKIHAILKYKAAQGVEIRLLYDDIGSAWKAPEKFRQNLKHENIQVIAFGQAQQQLSHLYLNHRNHQKIVIIDGHIGYTGGTNLADEYANIYAKFGHWKDTAIRIEGDAVWSLTVTFLEMWESESQVKEDYLKYRPTRTVSGDGFYQPFADGPVNNPNNPAEMMYRQIIASARDYIYITTPYLVLDENMMDEICLAAQGGVDVRIITPRIWDKWYVHKVTQSNYRRLVEAGVRIYEYNPGFLHAKTILSDDDHAVTGSINMDYRSFYLQFENGVWICGAPVLVDIKRDLEDTIAISEEVSLDLLKRIPWHERLLQTFMRLFAPLF